MEAVAQRGLLSNRVWFRDPVVVSGNPQPFRPAFAVVRVDGPLDRSMSPEAVQERITVKKIVWTEGDAEAEVARLNAIERERPPERRAGCFYFAQYTRVFDDGQGGSVRGR
jgi:hypothetical protein